IYVHQMGGFSVKAVKEYFETNDLVEPVAMMAIGYLGNGSGLNAELRRRDSDRRPRKHLSEFVFRNDMKTPAFR
ncbi:MAG: hypothetical protein ACUVTX_09970, partial [Bacteroidales bacterium]